MEEKNNKKPFSVKELLKSILISIAFTTFIGFTIMFVAVMPSWITTEVMIGIDNDSEIIIDIGNETNEGLEKTVEAMKDEYGEDYPALGVMLYRTYNHQRAVVIVNTYVSTVLYGIVLGVSIYIVSIQGAKGKQLAKEMIISFIIILLIIVTINFGYRAIINKAISDINITDLEHYYYTSIYNIENNFFLYIGLFVIVYIGNLIHQKILANKLNKALKIGNNV